MPIVTRSIGSSKGEEKNDLIESRPNGTGTPVRELPLVPTPPALRGLPETPLVHPGQRLFFCIRRNDIEMPKTNDSSAPAPPPR